MCGVKAKPVNIELLSAGNIANLKVDVADRGSTDHRILHSLFGQIVPKVLVWIQKQTIHLDLAVDPAPFTAVPVPVQLNAVAFRIIEVKRFTDQVIRATG